MTCRRAVPLKGIPGTSILKIANLGIEMAIARLCHYPVELSGRRQRYVKLNAIDFSLEQGHGKNGTFNTYLRHSD
jgi:hypothetical protein